MYTNTFCISSRSCACPWVVFFLAGASHCHNTISKYRIGFLSASFLSIPLRRVWYLSDWPLIVQVVKHTASCLSSEYSGNKPLHLSSQHSNSGLAWASTEKQTFLPKKSNTAERMCSLIFRAGWLSQQLAVGSAAQNLVHLNTSRAQTHVGEAEWDVAHETGHCTKLIYILESFWTNIAQPLCWLVWVGRCRFWKNMATKKVWPAKRRGNWNNNEKRNNKTNRAALTTVRSKYCLWCTKI